MDNAPSSFTPGYKLLVAAVIALAVGAWGVNQVFKAGISFKELAHWQKPTSTNDTVTVTGEGKVTAIPDIGVVSLAVEMRAATVSAVQTQVTQKMNEIVAYLKGMDIDKKDIKTTQYSLYPDYRYDPQNGKQTLEGYRLNQQVEVKVRDLDKVGEAIGGAVDRGANQVGNLTFSIDDPEALKQQARLEAIAQAKSKASALAKAAGVRLGKVRSFNENVNAPSPYPIYYANDSMGMMESKAVAPQVEAGSQEITVDVNISFEIL
jgi:uncharacterized protein